MMNLGFISDERQLPDGYWAVTFQPDEAPAGGSLNATINGRKGPDGRHRFELVFGCPPAAEILDDWSTAMALRLMDMDLTRFVLDARALAAVLSLPLKDALTEWGFPFFEHYAMDAVMLFHAGRNAEDRGPIYQAMLAWSDHFREVRFNPDLDFDTLARENKPVSRGPLGFLRDRLLGRRADA